MARPTPRSPRLAYREIEPGDLERLHELAVDPHIRRYLLDGQVVGRDWSAAAIATSRRMFEERSLGLWLLHTRAPGATELIGFAGLAHPTFEAHFTPCVEIGWRLDAGQWGRGYATEAAAAILRAAFVHLHLDEVVAFTSLENRRSRRVMEKLGMRRDPADDFDHPGLREGHPLRRHVLYRIDRVTRRGGE